MKPGEISIDLRVRDPWEAIDLGTVMYRAWFRALLMTWLAVYTPVVVMSAWVFSDRLWAAGLLLWWLKPVFERFLLHVASRAAFGAPPGVSETLSAWREILAPLPWLWVTLGRPFYVQRAYTMPVSQLERQRGPARRARERILGRRAMSAGGWMAIICAHFEVSIMMSLYVLVAAMTPWESTNLGSFLQHLSTSGQSPYGFGNLLVQAIATTLVAPLFVCSGFSLYLNRRTQLEAWDIEVNLRRIEERASAMTLSDRRRAARSLVIALLATAVLMFPRGQATADEASGVTPPAQREPPTAATEDDAAREALKGVLAAPEFQTTKVEKRWRLRPRERSDPPGGHWERLTGFFQLLAEVLRGIVWIVAIAGGATVIVLVAKRLVPAAPAPDAHRPQDVLLGMEIGPASLPRDVASAARDLLLRGEARAALALLYRGALSAIVHQHRVEVTPGATEADVLGAYRTAVGGDASIYFERLVRQWAAAAYAGQPIDPGAGRALCDDWPRYFDPAASPLNA